MQSNHENGCQVEKFQGEKKTKRIGKGKGKKKDAVSAFIYENDT